MIAVCDPRTVADMRSLGHGETSIGCHARGQSGQPSGGPRVRLLPAPPVVSRGAPGQEAHPRESFPVPVIEAIRRTLAGEVLIRVAEALTIERSWPHGHVAAALGTARK